MDPVIGPVDSDEALAEIAQGGPRADVRLGQHDPNRPPRLVDDLAVFDLVLRPCRGRACPRKCGDAQFRLLGHLDLGHQGARRRIPAGNSMPAAFRTRLTSSVAPDEIVGPQRPAVWTLDVDAGVVLQEPVTCTSAIERHRCSSPTQPARCARCAPATARARRGAVGKSLMSKRSSRTAT